MNSMEMSNAISGGYQLTDIDLNRTDFFTFAMKNLDADQLPSFVKLHNRLLSFPEKLMIMIHYVDKTLKKEGESTEKAAISWDIDGSRFFIRSRQGLITRWLPLFFDQVKYSSFLRKLYRWGFRKTTICREVSSGGTLEEVVSFRSRHFLRDQPDKMADMCSVTAAKVRRASASKKDSNQQRATTGEDADAALDGVPRPATVDLTSVLPLLTALQQNNMTEGCNLALALLQGNAFVRPECVVPNPLSQQYNVLVPNFVAQTSQMPLYAGPLPSQSVHAANALLTQSILTSTALTQNALVRGIALNTVNGPVNSDKVVGNVEERKTSQRANQKNNFT